MGDYELQESFFRVSSTYYLDEKVAGLSPSAEVLFLRMCAISSQLRTDGVLNWYQLGTASVLNLSRDCTRLVLAGLIERLDDSRQPSYRITNYLKWNPSKAQLEEAREKKRESGRKGGIVAGLKRKGEADAIAGAEANAVAKSNQSKSKSVVTNVTTEALASKTDSTDPLLDRLLRLLPKGEKTRELAAEELAEWRKQAADWVIEDAIIDCENRGVRISSARYVRQVIIGRYEDSGNFWVDDAG